MLEVGHHRLRCLIESHAHKQWQKRQRRRKRKERKELKRAAMARALELQANGEQDFEGFQVRPRCGAAPRAFHLIS